MSHSSKQKCVARALATALKSDTDEIFLDEDSLIPGEPYRQAIAQQLNKSDILIWLMSADSINGYSLREVQQFADSHVDLTNRILPIQIEDFDDTKIEPRLAELQRVRPSDYETDTIVKVAVAQLESMRLRLLRPGGALIEELESARNRLQQAKRDKRENHVLRKLNSELFQIEHELLTNPFKPMNIIGDGHPGYILIEKIGQGGTAAVWKAQEQAESQNIVAVKILLPQYASSQLHRERFIRGTSAMAELSHPNIVAMHQNEVFHAELATGGYYYLFNVMRYIEGLNLANHKRIHGIHPSQIAAVVQTVAKALTVAHGNNVVHRDIKPQNIIVPADGDFTAIKLTDFDLVTSYSDLPNEHAITSIFSQCTPAYAAPELLAASGPDRLDEVRSPRVDVYGISSTAIFMLAQGNNDPRPFDKYYDIDRLRCSDSLKLLLKQATSIDPQKRPSLTNFAQRFRTLIKSHAQDGSARDPDYKPPPAKLRHRSAWPLIAVIGLALLVAFQLLVQYTF